MNYQRGELAHKGETICRITNPSKSDEMTVDALFTGLLVGVLENPVVCPGNPLCHFIKLGEIQDQIIEKQRGIPHM